MTRDRWILTTAWALIATAAAAGLWKISKTPAIDPEIAGRKIPVVGSGPEGSDLSLARLDEQWKRFTAEGTRPHEKSLYFAPRGHETVKDVVIVTVPVQPWVATPAAKAALDGTTLTWTLTKGPVALRAHERAKDVAPTGIRIERNDGSGWKDVATLDAKATTWKDVETAPRTSYAYRVKLESPAGMPKAEDGPPAEARTPSDRRARLVGGDAKVALFKVETYDRKKGAWVGRDATVRPGEALWPGGWKLTGLKFNKFELVAAAVDEDGRALELTTRD